MKFLKELLFGAAQAPGGAEGANGASNPNSNDDDDATAGAAAATTDDFDEPKEDPYELDENAKPPARGNNNKTKKKKSVQISNFRLFDKEAPAADSLQDYPIVNSVKGKRPAYQYTREELQIIKDERENKPDQGSLTLACGHKVSNLQNVILSDFSTHDFLPNPYGMRYSVDSLGFDPEHNPGSVFFAGVEDDGMINKAMAYFLMSHEAKTLEALESFYKEEIKGNWTEFKRRNKERLKKIVALAAEASGMAEEEDAESETYEHAMVRILEQGFEQMATTTENMRVDYQANVHMFFRQMDAQREDSKQMKSMHDDHVAQSKRSQRDLYKLAKVNRSNSTPRGRFQSDDYSITSSPSSIASSPSSQGSPPVQQKRTGMIGAPKTARKAPSKVRGMETPTSRKTINRSFATERKVPVKGATKQESRPAPKKKKKTAAAAAATLIVKRAFKPGCEFPKNSQGVPCGCCVNEWKAKNHLCKRWNHDRLLDELTHIVDE